MADNGGSARRDSEEVVEVSGLLGRVAALRQVSRVHDSLNCELCTMHADNLTVLHNFSLSFINGTTGSELKKENVF